MNLHRRHLTTAQRAALALDLLPHLEEEARERQAEAGGANPGPLPPMLEEAKGEATEKAAELVGVGRSTVAAAKAIQKRDPEIVNEMKAGATTAGALLNLSPRLAQRIRLREQRSQLAYLAFVGWHVSRGRQSRGDLRRLNEPIRLRPLKSPPLAAVVLERAVQLSIQPTVPNLHQPASRRDRRL